MKSAKEILELVRKGGLYPFYREDIFVKWREREDILKKWQEEIQKDQRKECFESVINLGIRLSAHIQVQVQNAILNAGKADDAGVNDG